MKNANLPAMPIFDSNAKLCIVRDPDTGKMEGASGLSKREHFTAMAMQGFCSDSQIFITEDFARVISKQAVEVADALLKELERTECQD